MLSSPNNSEKKRAAQAQPEPAASLKFLYETPVGRAVLRLISGRTASRAVGAFMSSPLSKSRIAPFIEKNGIDMSDYEEREFSSFNDFFTRRVKEGMRTVDPDPDKLCAPCDARLTVLPIGEDSLFNIKNTSYSVASMLESVRAARMFDGGYAMIFRLAVDNYHRVCFFDSGEKSRSRFIPGKLHTVQAIATENGKDIFARNCRSVSLLKTDNFGLAAMIYVGALMVGRIVENMPERCSVLRGEEAGRFEFGGSTVVILLKKGAAEIDGDILEASASGLETCVRYGEAVGVRAGVKERPFE